MRSQVKTSHHFTQSIQLSCLVKSFASTQNLTTLKKKKKKTKILLPYIFTNTQT